MRLRAPARGVLDLTRPVNAVAAGGLTGIGAYVAGGLAARPGAAAAAVVATVLATGAGNAINDYFDRDVDRINAPDRPLPRGAVTPRGALALSVVLFAFAVAFALTLPALAIAIAIVNLAALVLYTEVFKGTPGGGNAVVAYLGGSTFLFGGAAVGDVGAAGVLFVLAALSTFAREVVKDVEDMPGDASAGLTTLPLLVGAPRALAIAGVALGLAVVASPVPYLAGTFGALYLAAVLPADVVMVSALAAARTDPARGQALLKYGQFIAAAAFLLGRAVA